ncbi:MAG: hypothetical protein QXS29_10055 [Nitrososphaeria archaeon]
MEHPKQITVGVYYLVRYLLDRSGIAEEEIKEIAKKIFGDFKKYTPPAIWEETYEGACSYFVELFEFVVDQE